MEDKNSPRLSKEERTQLFTEGKCFICKMPGHYGRNCSEKKAPVSDVKVIEDKDSEKEQL